VKKALDEYRSNKNNAASVLRRSRRVSETDNTFVLKRCNTEEYLLDERVIHAYEVRPDVLEFHKTA